MFFLTQNQFFLGGLFVLVLAAAQTFLHIRKRSKLPPGPLGLPILGNIGSLPPAGQPEFRHWLSFREKYGPISSITVMGQTIVMVNDLQIAYELLDKRSTKYSSRPQMFFATVTCKLKEWPGFQANIPELKETRKDIHSVAGTTNALRRAVVFQDEEITKFIVRCAKDPSAWRDNLSKTFSAIVLWIGYGYRAEPEGLDPLTSINKDSIRAFNLCSTAGKWAVDVFNWMHYIPEWAPGGGFKKSGRKYERAMVDAPAISVRFTADRVAQGRSEPCLMSDLLTKRKEISKEEYFRLNKVGASLTGGGAETVSLADYRSIWVSTDLFRLLPLSVGSLGSC
jgi:hypothetical protein